MTVLAVRAIQKTRPFSIPERSKSGRKADVEIYLSLHANFIRALAKKFTASPEEAEAAENEIFNDIWLFAEQECSFQSTEDVLSSLIARRRLIKYLQ